MDSHIVSRGMPPGWVLVSVPFMIM